MQQSSSYYYRVKTQGGVQHQDLLLHILTREGNITITIALTQIWSSRLRTTLNMSLHKNHTTPAQTTTESCFCQNLSIRHMYHLYLEIFDPEQYECMQQGLPFSVKVKEHFYR